MEDYATQQEHKEANQSVHFIYHRISFSVGEEKPTKADKDSRYLYKEEHNAEDDHEVHEVKRLVERCRSNQVMRISLIIQRGPTLDYEAREKYVREEVPARVQQSPHVDIPWRINTLI